MRVIPVLLMNEIAGLDWMSCGMANAVGAEVVEVGAGEEEEVVVGSMTTGGIEVEMVGGVTEVAAVAVA